MTTLVGLVLLAFSREDVDLLRVRGSRWVSQCADERNGAMLSGKND